MLLQQLFLLQQHFYVLTCHSAQKSNPKEMAELAGAAARVQAELRRTAIALKDYRMAAGGRSVTVKSVPGSGATYGRRRIKHPFIKIGNVYAGAGPDQSAELQSLSVQPLTT